MLRAAVVWRLLVLPFLVTVGSWELLGSIESLSRLVPYTEPIGTVLATPAEKVAEFTSVVVFLCVGVAGYLLGWVLNFVALALSRRYRWKDMVEALLRGRVPVDWKVRNAEAKLQVTREKDRAEWIGAKKMGWLRYVVLRGGIVFGFLAVLAVHVLLNLIQSQPIVLSSLPFKFVLWVILGMVLTASRWLALASAHRDEA